MLVSRRAQGRCEYCLISEADTFLPHEPDHIIAVQHGGLATAENLALACFECNRLKGPNIASLDPDTKEIVRLFNPRQDRWSDHFRLDGPTILPLTAFARATVALLKFNSPERWTDRQFLFKAGRFPPAE